MYMKQKQAAGNNMSGILQKRDMYAWNSRIRAAYWAIGLTAGAILTYTTRYYLNGDGINYIEMGEALRHGWWSGLVNLTESPGYAFLLGLGQIVLNTNRLNELQLLKCVNFVCFVVAMLTCELFINLVRRQYQSLCRDAGQALPFPLISALSYSMFLFATLRLDKTSARGA